MAGSAPAELRRIAQQMRALPLDIVEDGARNVVQKDITTALAAATGGDRSLSRAPGKLKVDVKIKGGGSTVTAEVQAGPKKGIARWSWLEKGTKPHQIGRGQHPGTTGKRVWSGAAEPALRRVQRDAETKWRQAVNS